MVKLVQTVLSDRHVMNMLLFLLDNGKVKESQLTAVVKNYYTAVDVAAKLVNNKLADSWSEKDGHTVKVYALTDLGHLIAEDLKRANDRFLEAQAADPTIGVAATAENITASVALADALASKCTEKGARGGAEDLLNDGGAGKSANGGGDAPSKLRQKLFKSCFRIDVVAMWGKTFPALRKSRACRVSCLSTGNGKKRRPPSANNYHDP